MRFAMRLLAMGALVAGALLVLHSVGLLAWQYFELIENKSWTALPARLWFVDQSGLTGSAAAPVLGFIPQWHWPWVSGQPVAAWILDRLHIGLLPAALGAALVWRGRIVIQRQTEAIRVYRQRKEDGMRRAQIYRRERPFADERKEPVLDSEPVLTDRRVAGDRG